MAIDESFYIDPAEQQPDNQASPPTVPVEQLYMEPPVPRATTRKTQASDQIENPIARFTVDVLETMVGEPVAWLTNTVLSPVRDAGENYLQNLENEMDENPFNDNILTKVLTAGQTADIIPKRFDLPEFKRYLAAHQYEYVSDKANPTQQAAGEKVPYGEGAYVGQNPGSGVGTAIKTALPIMGMQRGMGRDLRGGIMKSDKGQEFILPKAKDIGRTDLGYKTKTFLGRDFAQDAAKATRFETGLAAGTGFTGMFLANKYYDDAVLEGKSQEEAENARFAGELIGTFGFLGGSIGLDVTKNVVAPIYQKVSPVAWTANLLKSGKDKITGKYTGFKDSKIYEGIGRDKDGNLKKFSYASAVDPERFSGATVQQLQQFAASGDVEASRIIKKVGERLQAILNDQNNLDDFLQGVTINSGYKMSAQQSKSLLKQAGVENIDFNLPEQIGAHFDPTFRTLARELGEASDEGTQKFNARLIKNVTAIRMGLNHMIGDGINPNFTALYDTASGLYRPLFSQLDDDSNVLVEMTNKFYNDLPNVSNQTDLYKAGATIQENLIAGKARWQESMSNLADSLGINSDDTIADAVKFNEAKTNLKNKIFPGQDPTKGTKAETLNPAIQRILDFNPSEMEKGLTFMEWKVMREKVSDAYGKALNFGTSEVKDLRITLDQLDEMGELFGATNKNFKDWSDLYSQGKDFWQGSLYKMSRPTSGYVEAGAKEIPLYINRPERVADAFIADVDSAKQFMSIPNLAEDVTLQQAIQGRFFDKMRDAIQNADGTINQSKFDTFIAKNSEVIDSMPFLKSVVGDSEQSLSQIMARNSQLAQRRTEVAENQMYQAVQSMGNVDDPLGFINQLYGMTASQIRSAKADLLEQAKNSGADVIEVERVFNRAFMSKFLSNVSGETSVFQSLASGDMNAIKGENFERLAKGFKNLLGKATPEVE